MRSHVFLPDRQCLAIDEIVVDEKKGRVEVTVHSTAEKAECPACGMQSSRIHSWYQRKLTDLPWQGLSVVLTWRTRKFFCRNEDCKQRIFAERLSQVAASYARRTDRINLALRCIAFACGGEGGCRLADRLGMAISPDSLLREIRRTSISKQPVPRVLGVDDWAFRKGQTYGTILIDMERGIPIELLPDRDAETFKQWLQDHPGIEIISRDRGDCYVKGATEGAPQAVQVADRFHLTQNLREALSRLLDRSSKQVRSAVDQIVEECNDIPVDDGQLSVPANVANSSVASESLASQNRRELYEAVMALHKQGNSKREIARRLRINRATVRNFVQSDGCPERAKRRYSSQSDPCADYLWARWNQGCHNVRQLTNEVRAKGFTASYYSIRRRVSKWRKSMNATLKPPPKRSAKMSPKQISWLVFKDESQLSEFERSLKAAVFSNCAEIERGWEIACDFLRLFKNRVADGLTRWLENATDPSVPKELQRFAFGIKRDCAAVLAAITLPWNNGQTEGHVNRLKTIKRQMYGRGNFDLLRLRVLQGS
jgi:transposase